MSIDSIVNLAAQKIGEIVVGEAKLLHGVKDQVESLGNELTMMTSFLIDMDEGGDKVSRSAIKEIRKIAYEAEDVIESFVVENSSSGNKMEDLFKKYACFCCSILSTHKIGTEIEAIKVRIGEATERRKVYLGQNGIRRDATRARVRRPASYAHHNEDHIVGLDDDMKKLVRVLTADDDEENQNRNEVVLIVGMGGSGKTTLARKLINHKFVKIHFNFVVWVSISEQWAIAEIVDDLLRNARGEGMGTNEVLSFKEQVEKLHQCLEGKRYLIVLDDVWKKEALEEIFSALPTVNEGSKIIVTTRNQQVVDFPDLKCFIHEPRRLSEGESWELFSKIAFIHNSTTADITLLEALGREMLKKCEGLPLAVIALAGILGKKETVEEWEKIKKAVSSRIMEDGRGTRLYGAVNEMLALSYTDLPRELKLCFLYLAVFQEDSEISAGKLVRMWIAEGFITSDDLHECESMEDVARRYLDELIHRCVVQIARKNYKGKVTRIRIHDLVRDLCIKKAKQQDFLEIFTSNSPNSDARVTESRRAAIYASNSRAYVPFPTKSQHIRSLVYYAVYENNQIPNPGLQLIHKRFRLLRVLSLERISSSDGTLPGIRNLIHLRYLCIKFTNITQLPSSIANLHNLQTLDLRFIQKHNAFIRIPNVFWKLKGLRHLYLPHLGYRSDNAMKKLRLHTLKDLQTLWGVRGGKWMLEELPHLSQSVQKLYISGISSSGQVEAAFQCPSIISDRLHSLELNWESAYQSQEGEVLTLKNLQAITHCRHLRSLSLCGRIEEDTLSFPAGIMKLELFDTQFEADSSLAALGKLPNLVILCLSRNAYRGTKWSCCAGDFPMLKELRLNSLDNLEEWSIERGAMPQLRSLNMSFCQRLRRISEGLKFVTTLQKLSFLGMSDEFNKRCKGGEDAHIIQHVPSRGLY